VVHESNGVRGTAQLMIFVHCIDSTFHIVMSYLVYAA